VYLFFAGLLRDDRIVIDHWITEENWNKAIDTLSRQVRPILCADTLLTVRRKTSTSITNSRRF
jgi:hypothetical protein